MRNCLKFQDVSSLALGLLTLCCCQNVISYQSDFGQAGHEEEVGFIEGGFQCPYEEQQDIK